MTRRPGRARVRGMEETPTEIDGMRVLIDRRVTLFPVTLVEPADAEGAGSAMAGAASRSRARRPRTRSVEAHGRNGRGRNGHGHALA